MELVVRILFDLECSQQLGDTLTLCAFLIAGAHISGRLRNTSTVTKSGQCTATKAVAVESDGELCELQSACMQMCLY